MELEATIIKADNEKQLVVGVVLEPDSEDAQGDIIKADTIEKAAHDYLVKSRTIYNSHSSLAKCEVVESYIAPSDFYLNGQTVKKGSWVMACHISDPQMWKGVKSGDYTGFSIGGVGSRKVV